MTDIITLSGPKIDKILGKDSVAIITDEVLIGMTPVRVNGIDNCITMKIHESEGCHDVFPGMPKSRQEFLVRELADEADPFVYITMPMCHRSPSEGWAAAADVLEAAAKAARAKVGGQAMNEPIKHAPDQRAAVDARTAAHAGDLSEILPDQECNNGHVTIRYWSQTDDGPAQPCPVCKLEMQLKCRDLTIAEHKQALQLAKEQSDRDLLRISSLEALAECNKAIIEQKDKNRDALQARVLELEAKLEHEYHEVSRLSCIGQEQWRKREQLEARLDAMTALLGMDTPHPMRDVFRKLADAADILFSRYNYDGHGHEALQIARDRAREYADNIDAALKAAADGAKS